MVRIDLLKRIKKKAFEKYMKKYNDLKYNSLAISEGIVKLATGTKQ